MIGIYNTTAASCNNVIKEENTFIPESWSGDPNSHDDKDADLSKEDEEKDEEVEGAVTPARGEIINKNTQRLTTVKIIF